MSEHEKPDKFALWIGGIVVAIAFLSVAGLYAFAFFHNRFFD